MNQDKVETPAPAAQDTHAPAKKPAKVDFKVVDLRDMPAALIQWQVR